MAGKKSISAETKWMSTSRIQSLTDCIFAFAMTLLVFNLIMPNANNDLSETQLSTFLGNQAKEFYNYVISFFILAIFWMTHTQQFHYFQGTNRTHLWINVVTLMFIVLIPFSTSLMSDYPLDPMADIFFGLNLLIVGLLYYVNWEYATSNYRFIKKDVSKAELDRAKRESLAIPIVAVFSMIFAFTAPFLAEFSYVLIPIVRLLMAQKKVI